MQSDEDTNTFSQTFDCNGVFYSFPFGQGTSCLLSAEYTARGGENTIVVGILDGDQLLGKIKKGEFTWNSMAIRNSYFRLDQIQFYKGRPKKFLSIGPYDYFTTKRGEKVFQEQHMVERIELIPMECEDN